MPTISASPPSQLSFQFSLPTISASPPSQLFSHQFSLPTIAASPPSQLAQQSNLLTISARPHINDNRAMFQAKVNWKALHWHMGASVNKKRKRQISMPASSLPLARQTKLKWKAQPNGKANVKGKADGQDQEQAQPQ